MFVLYPVAKPIALMLDIMLGGGVKPTTYRTYSMIGEDGSSMIGEDESIDAISGQLRASTSTDESTSAGADRP